MSLWERVSNGRWSIWIDRVTEAAPLPDAGFRFLSNKSKFAFVSPSATDPNKCTILGPRTYEDLQNSEGFVGGRAVSLPQPSYPAAAKAARATGTVVVRILIMEDGSVFSAEPVSGHPLLRPAAWVAACKAKYTPTTLKGTPIQVYGRVTYNFVP